MKLLELRDAINVLIAATPNAQSAMAVITISGEAGVVEVTGVAVTDDGTASRVVDLTFEPIPTP